MALVVVVVPFPPQEVDKPDNSGVVVLNRK